MISRTPFTRSFAPGTRLSACFAGVAAIAVATLGFASAAGAAGTAPAIVKPPAGVHPLAAGLSTYLAGYQATPTGGLASASVTFTVPKISCTTADKNKSAAEWNGVYTDSLNVYAFVAGYCPTSGAPLYDWVFATLAGPFDKSGAAAGDVVVASLFQSGSSTYAEIHDLTAERVLVREQLYQPGGHYRRHRDLQRSSQQAGSNLHNGQLHERHRQRGLPRVREPDSVQRVERGRPAHQERQAAHDRCRFGLHRGVQEGLVEAPGAV